MATTNTDAFPVNDTEYSVVDPAVNTLFSKFDYKDQGAQNDEQLFKAHGAKLTEVKDQASTRGQVVYRGPVCVVTLLAAAWLLTDGRMPLILLFMSMLLSII